MSGDKTITTTCTRDCPNTCGLEATIRDDRVVKLVGSKSHPYTRGTACVKAARYLDLVYHRERIVVPMIKRDGRWHKSSWDEALDLIAEKMQSIKESDGPEAILYYQGYGERTALKLLNSYFFNLFGGVTTVKGSLCGGTGQASQNLDLGERISHDPMDHYNSKAMILWGRNPVSTNISLVPIIKAISSAGGRVLVIDPCKTKSAALADCHIAPRPGKDAFLAMACSKLILEYGAEDRSFLKESSSNFAKFQDLLNRYSLKECCRFAGVSTEDASYLAETMVNYRPTSILLGWGLHRHRDAHDSIRAIDALAAICGYFGIPGGGVSQGFEEYGPYDQKYWGHHLHPHHRQLSMPIIGEEIINAKNPAIRMIFTTAANPVCMAPNSAKVKKAFLSTEFNVYCGHFLNDTADCSDVFLPATTFLEEDDIMATYGHNWVGPVNKAVSPPGDCLSDYDMFSRLAERFDFTESYCKEPQHWLNLICKPIVEAGCSMEMLRKAPFRLPQPMVPYRNRKFPTPSQKFEFMTELTPLVTADYSKKYPYKLLTIAPHGYICSERAPSDHNGLPVVKLHPDEIAAIAASDGAAVWVESICGRIKARLVADNTLRRDCLMAERGGWIKAGHGLNLLTLDMASTVGEGTPYYETCVRVLPASSSKP